MFVELVMIMGLSRRQLFRIVTLLCPSLCHNIGFDIFWNSHPVNSNSGGNGDFLNRRKRPLWGYQTIQNHHKLQKQYIINPYSPLDYPIMAVSAYLESDIPAPYFEYNVAVSNIKGNSLLDIWNNHVKVRKQAVVLTGKYDINDHYGGIKEWLWGEYNMMFVELVVIMGWSHRQLFKIVTLLCHSLCHSIAFDIWNSHLVDSN